MEKRRRPWTLDRLDRIFHLIYENLVDKSSEPARLVGARYSMTTGFRLKSLIMTFSSGNGRILDTSLATKDKATTTMVFPGSYCLVDYLKYDKALLGKGFKKKQCD